MMEVSVSLSLRGCSCSSMHLPTYHSCRLHQVSSQSPTKFNFDPMTQNQCCVMLCWGSVFSSCGTPTALWPYLLSCSMSATSECLITFCCQVRPEEVEPLREFYSKGLTNQSASWLNELIRISVCWPIKTNVNIVHAFTLSRGTAGFHLETVSLLPLRKALLVLWVLSLWFSYLYTVRFLHISLQDWHSL